MTDPQTIGHVLRNALDLHFLRSEDSAMIFYDLTMLETRINRLKSAFPENTLHTLAIKANPLLGILRLTRDFSPSVGVEAATIGEVHLALKAGFGPERIVYDSPVKTMDELRFALARGIHINADSLAEVDRIGAILSEVEPAEAPAPSVAIRINPQVGTGTIAESSVAGIYSKFGVPLGTKQTELIDRLSTTPWLKGVHLHVGSQGCAPEMLTEGIGRLYDLVTEANRIRKQRRLPDLSIFDIGGGFPVSYFRDNTPPSMEAYVSSIKTRAPELLSTDSPSPFRIITEFGRWTYTHTGWTVSRVEYVKHDPGLDTLMLHVGADLFVRECLNPKDWQHEYSLFDQHGNLKTGGTLRPTNLAGPLCFAGDIIARNVLLPEALPGDYLVIHDTGSYTFSMWSRYNSRLTPRIAGYSGDRFTILKERETPEEMMRFWE
jgi:diaminopimelate decarboxylase